MPEWKNARRLRKRIPRRRKFLTMSSGLLFSRADEWRDEQRATFAPLDRMEMNGLRENAIIAEQVRRERAAAER